MIRGEPKIERREQNWKNVSVISIESNEVDIPPIADTVQRFAEQHGNDDMETWLHAVRENVATVRSELGDRLSQEDERLFSAFERYSDVIMKFVNSTDISTASLSELIQGSRPEVEMVRGTMPSFRDQSFDQSVRNMRAIFEQVSRSDSIMTSDSHAATPLLLSAVSKERFWPTHDTAVLSFDHHTDFMPDSSPDAVRKASQFSALFHHTDIAAGCVVGVQPFEATPSTVIDRRPADFITGKDLYTQGKPNADALRASLDPIFRKWKEMRVRFVYPSIDLDALQIVENQYTGVDYHHMYSMLVYMEKVKQWAEQVVDSEKQPDVLKEIQKETQRNIRTGGIPYYGVPASWITKSLRYARDNYGFEIGIRQSNTGRRLVGDVVEYAPQDYKGRTAKIAQAIMNSLIHI